jgi:hypothetical protein
MRKQFITRLITSLVVAFAIGTTLHWTLKKFERHDAQPAGFGQGIVHGALMPLALPNLLIGDDVQIYAPLNTGRGYKVGYIAGVNGCGLIFFGYFFWRGRRLQKDLRATFSSK